MQILISAPSDGPAEALANTVATAGLDVVGTVPCHMLVREAVRLAPQLVVVLADAVDAGLFDLLDLLQASVALPVVLCCARQPRWAAERAHAAGVRAWLDAPVTPRQLALALPVARQCFEQERRLRDDLEAARARLDERKWVDRAKGVLMQSQQMSEDQAFALLRTASMQANLRVGEVSRAVHEAARAAEAVNRAGQLRMLSQRLVKASALGLAGTLAANADEVRRDSLQRGQACIEHLQALPLDADADHQRLAVTGAWQTLQQRCAQPLADAAALGEADRCAEGLLDAAERLTAALEVAGGRPSLQVVNLCGRQRMHVQRLAKQALLAGLLPTAAADLQVSKAVATVAAFDAAQAELERAPLTSEEIRATLAQARGQWTRLLAGVQRATGGEGRAAVALESDALLASFDRLTTLYERSLQLLMS